MPPTARVFLLAGNRLLREALSRMLKRRSDFLVVGEASHSADANDLIVHSDCDVLVTDPVSTPQLNFEFLNDLRRSLPGIKVVMIGMDENESSFLRAVRAGVAGYLLKDASAMDVLTAIRAVAQEEAVCPPKLCMRLFNVISRDINFAFSERLRTHVGLTRRERELVPLIARGLTNKEIASRLNLAEPTVKNHVHRMLGKIGVSDRASIVERVRSQEFVF
jgi:DNA-binding NarL/FixJ family response regulator